MRTIHRLVCLCLLVFALAGAVSAQTTQTYAYRNNPFTYDNPSGAAITVPWHASGASPACTGFPNGDDDWADINFPAGFSFTFNGVAYTSVRIYSNGILAWGNDVSGFHRTFTATALPAGAPGAFSGCPRAAPVNVMLAYWLDIVAGTANSTSGASVRYELLGSAPNRRMVISWVNVKLFNTSTRYNFQISLFEGASAICAATAPAAPECVNSEFEYRYTTGSSDGSNATVGVQLSASDFTQYSFNQIFIDTVNGTALRWYPAPPAAQASLGAEYRFDESAWSGVQGEVTDTSGSGLNGVAIGGADTTATQFRICRAALIPSNNNSNQIDAVALGNPGAGSGYVPSNSGGMSFWYYPLGNGTNNMLFDATVASGRPFYVMRTSANQIKVGISDSVGTTATATTTTAPAPRNAWVHVAVSWKVLAGSNATIIQIFINGALQIVTRSTTNGALPALAVPAYAGDNRTVGVTPNGGTGTSANGYLDELRLYPAEIDVTQARIDFLATRSTCNALHHFDISINGTTGPSSTLVSALTCEAVGITITARDITNNLVSTSTAVALATNTGNGTLSAVSGASNFTASTGAANFTFNNTDTVVLQFADRIEEAVNFNLASGLISERAQADPTAQFSHEGLRFVTDSSGSTLASAATYNGASCTDRSVFVQAVKTDQSTFSCVANTAITSAGGKLGNFRNGQSPTLALAMQCVDPANCLSTGRALINGATLLPQGGNAAATPAAANFLDVTMAPITNNNAVASFTFRYRDAGKIRLYASYNAQDAAGLTVTTLGQSPQFAVAPAGFAMCNVARGTSVCADNSSCNQNGSTLADALFARAGETFSTDVWALSCGNASACTSYADAAACVAGNACAGNFGQETAGNKHGGGSFSLQSNTAVSTGGTAVAPVQLAPPVFANGKASTYQLLWNEAGVLGARLNLANFFGSAAPCGGALGAPCPSTAIGRFAPYQFLVAASDVCVAGGFTYSGQGFSASVTAKAKDGVSTTANYDGTLGFARPLSLVDSAASAGGFTANSSFPAASFVAGGVAAVPVWAFTSRTTAPATLALVGRYANAADQTSDQAADQTTSANVHVRSGRLNLQNAYGSEKLALDVPGRLQYFASTGWLTNSADSCTVLPAAITKTTALTTTLTCNGAACNAGTAVAAGDFVLRLSAPNAAGFVDLLLPNWLAAYSYLPLAGSLSSAGARATFGIHKGSDKTIYRRERY